jgi:hypothetical protein
MTARRRWLHFSVLAALSLGGASLAGSVALAKSAAPAIEERPVIDITADRAKLQVLTDGTLYYVVHRDGGIPKAVYVGDSKTLYKQALGGGGSDGTEGTWSTMLRASRLPSGFGQLAYRDKKYLLSCDTTDTAGIDTELTALDAAATKAFLDTAVFREHYWRRGARSLARDDAGTYYLVDEFRAEYGGKGFRVFVGKRGAMKEMKMTSVVSDSAGDIYSTKSGELRFVTGTEGTATWIKGKKKTPLIFLPVPENLRLIYRDLGIYGFLGQACEDM